MWDFSIGKTFKLMMHTLPFLGLRLLVYFGVALGYVLVTGMGAGMGYGLAALSGPGTQSSAAVWGGIIGFGVFGVFMYWAREYLLYLVKAGHIAILVILLDGQTLPQGTSQIRYGSEAVKARFAQTSILFAMDQLIKGVIKALTGLVRGALSIVSLPGAQQLSGILHAFLRVAVGFVDEVILARTIRTASTNPWVTAKDSVILYGQNYKVMLKNAAWVAAMVYLFSFLVFLIMLAPASLVVYWMPGAWSAGAFVFALLFAWSIKAALLEPFAITCLMDVYFKTIEGQQPDQEWEARLEQMSGKFRALKEQAHDAMRAAGKAPGDLEQTTTSQTS
ncbi:hypothetical protein [Allopusillimonas ginsengisoli]|uniref:hypothetical protein n=1 Tax=Allopusillimonas ginsengisoli TaxID=453575 RepID=UPI0010203C29|nr:hypothetical protein [Allopusillimonas ginsengisoli]TEA79323.1 hypothetical protein ERE07_08110 [Allopusillimonas ginsengisoli]